MNFLDVFENSYVSIILAGVTVIICSLLEMEKNYIAQVASDCISKFMLIYLKYLLGLF